MVEQEHFRRRLSDSAEFSFVSRFMLRTTDTPLGPRLNAYSSDGVSGQSSPLIGMDVVTSSNVTGFWPIFGTTQSNVEVNPANSHWVNVYGVSGAATTVACNDGEVIIGVRYLSHQTANVPTAQLSQLPDIQCSRLVVQEVNNYQFGTTHKKNVTINTDGSGTISTTDSVVDVQACMLNTTSPFYVSSSNTRLLNTCPGQAPASRSSYIQEFSSYTPAYAAPSFFVRRIADLHQSRHKGQLEGGRLTVGLIDFMVSRDIFGSSSLGGVDISSIASASKSSAASAYSSVWGSAPPSASQIAATLGPNPWDSSNLIVNSAQFLTGTVMSTSNVVLATGFSWDGVSLSVNCNPVATCQNGKCDSKKGCICDPGYSGPSCATRLNPCANNPCGQYGTCTENFEVSLNYQCACKTGWSGSNCQTTNDTCLTPGPGRIWGPVNCGQGQCLSEAGYDNAGNFTCKCNSGWINADNVTTGSCNINSVDCVGNWVPSTCNAKCQTLST